MNKILSFSLSVFLFLALLPSSLHSAATITVGSVTLQLNGIAIQSELRSDWFINALYLSEKSTDSQSILTDVSPKRMEMKVLADTLSGRRLKRFWVERIRSNNQPSEVLALAKQVRDFANVMGQNLEANDVIAIDFVPGQATRVTINGSVNANLSPDLFNMVLKSWVGDLPPSNEFKEAILGQTNFDTLLTRYQAIQPTEARIAAFDKKLQEQIALQQQKEEEARLAEERKIAQEKAAEEARQRQVELAKEEEKQSQLAAQAKAQEAEKEKQRLAEEARIAEEAANKPPVVEIPAGPSPEEIAAIKTSYTNAIKRHYTPQFEYPIRALMKRYGNSVFSRPKKGRTHGVVEINIEVDRDGDLVSGGVTRSSGEKILDEAVQKALFDSVPFPAMPSELEDETFSTVLSIDIPAPST
ncbi:TonB family protein [Kangiella sp. HZ709]|uniref:TonB family protein n=1 Tax=Kangiella sp. HZ709 TaxID=2666328 RepID=UPI0012AFC9F4|nr:TonB family protein [Kangiella sp. HZ709]MRX27067.1 TonB family protein [Kangiella sp. HZ709]